VVGGRHGADTVGGQLADDRPAGQIAPELESRVAARWEEYGIGIPYLDDQRRELLTMEQLSKRLPDI
jgi:hypothetical protein